MTEYLLTSKPMYLWLALALPVCSSLFLISKINDFSEHFVVLETADNSSAHVQNIDIEGL